MKILGISNPEFIGVTVATKAICTSHYPVPHLDPGPQIARMAEVVLDQKPNLLTVGGWSRGYLELLEYLRRAGRKFPVICVHHGTVFHRQAFNDGIYRPQMDAAVTKGLIDLMGYVHPGEADYQRTFLKKRRTLWVPHAFPASPIEPRKHDLKHFRVGVLGGMTSVLKNTDGAIQVAEAWCRQYSGGTAEVVSQQAYDKPHAEFLHLLSSCDSLLHLSWLECYPNILQEAWGLGVPTLAGPASLGLMHSPFFSPEVRQMLDLLTMKSTNDAFEVFEGLERILISGHDLRLRLWGIQKQLHASTNAYLWEMFQRIWDGYRNHSLYDARLFDAYPTNSLQRVSHLGM